MVKYGYFYREKFNEIEPVQNNESGILLRTWILTTVVKDKKNGGIYLSIDEAFSSMFPRELNPCIKLALLLSWLRIENHVMIIISRWEKVFCEFVCLVCFLVCFAWLHRVHLGCNLSIFVSTQRALHSWAFQSRGLHRFPKV